MRAILASTSTCTELNKGRSLSAGDSPKRGRLKRKGRITTACFRSSVAAHPGLHKGAPHVFAARGTRQGGASHPLHAAAIQADASKLDHLDRVADFVRKAEEKVDVVVQRQPSREGAVA